MATLWFMRPHTETGGTMNILSIWIKSIAGVNKTGLLSSSNFTRLFHEAMGLSEQNCLQALPDHSNIYIYPSGKNVYPWLADAAALVTDYSSIAYDFLLADKPIVYFQYDKQQYLQLRGNTLVSDDDFVAGETVTTVESLLVALRSEKELYAAQREKLRNKFETTPQLASPQIVSLVRE